MEHVKEPDVPALAVGTGLTVIVLTAVFVQPAAEVTVEVYVILPVADGVAVIFVPVVPDRPFPALPVQV